MTTHQGGAYDGFEGRVGRTFASSEPWWPPRPEAPAGAPNVVIVLADDLGFSDIGCFGSEIPTPNIDAIGAEGRQYVNFHVMPLCSPSRAALLTGRNAHAVGFGYTSNADPGYPGYTGELPPEQPTLADALRANGYSTLMVGKWHLCKDSDLTEAGDRGSWPLQRGFDQFYGFLEGMTNFHHPHRLYEGNSVAHVDGYPEGYYLTDDLTDRAVRMIREVKAANPAKPFFLYFAHGAVHAPLHAKPGDIARHRGRYDLGWDRLREQRFAKQLELGVMEPGTVLPPRNEEPGEDVAAWDSLGDRERALFARYMEVYAAMVASVDASVARVRQVLSDLGELENTLFVFTSDNGASREGRATGSVNYLSMLGGGGAHEPSGRDPLSDAQARLDEIGGPTTWPHYPRGWAMACNTPFRMYKVFTFSGGHRVPMVLSWPARLAPGPGGAMRRQYVHMTDVFPTLGELLDLDVPTHREGMPAKPLTGASFAPSIDDPDATTRHPEQYYECVGNRAYYRDGWAAVSLRDRERPFEEHHWQLFDVGRDPTERVDLAGAHPEVLRGLTDAWEAAAWENQVFPLDEGSGLKDRTRPPRDARSLVPTRILAGTPTLERFRSSALISGHGFRIDIDWSYGRGDEGVLVAHGGQESGYVLYVEEGLLHLVCDRGGDARALTPVALSETSKSVTVEVRSESDSVWSVVLEVDGTIAASGQLPRLRWFLPFEGIDVGIDRRSPVSWDLYCRRGTFPFTGDLLAVTYTPFGPPENRGIDGATALALD